MGAAPGSRSCRRRARRARHGLQRFAGRTTQAPGHRGRAAPRRASGVRVGVALLRNRHGAPRNGRRRATFQSACRPSRDSGVGRMGPQRPPGRRTNSSTHVRAPHGGRIALRRVGAFGARCRAIGRRGGRYPPRERDRPRHARLLVCFTASADDGDQYRVAAMVGGFGGHERGRAATDAPGRTRDRDSS